MTESFVPTYLCLKTATAQKLGRNGGGITYKILCDAERQQLYLTLVANEGGGYYSREVFSVAGVEACLPTDPAQAFAAKCLAPAMRGKSSNHPGFLAAILRAEGLLLPVDGQAHLHQQTETWEAWKASLLTQDGEPYVPPTRETQAAEPSDEMTRQELPGDAATESHPARRKVKRLRGAQPADGEGGEHAHPA